MLICRMGAWRIESDGQVSAHELASLEGLRAVDAARVAEAAQERRRLAEQVRELKRRAWRRAYSAGKLAALREYAGREAAAAFATQRLEDRLTQIVLAVVNDIVGELPPSIALVNQLRRAVAVAQAQRLVSLRVAPAAFDDAMRLIAKLGREYGAPLCRVLADAGLPAHSCVVETEAGVIDGGLAVQLRELERGIRDGVAAVLRSHDLEDGSGRTTLDTIGQGLRQTLDVLAAPLAIRPTPTPSPTPTQPTPPEPPVPPTRPLATHQPPIVRRVFIREAA